MTAGTLIAAELANAKLSGISWWSLLFSRHLKADLFAIDKPRFSLTTYESSDDDTTSDGTAGVVDIPEGPRVDEHAIFWNCDLHARDS